MKIIKQTTIGGVGERKISLYKIGKKYVVSEKRIFPDEDKKSFDNLKDAEEYYDALLVDNKLGGEDDCKML